MICSLLVLLGRRGGSLKEDKLAGPEKKGNPMVALATILAERKLIEISHF